MLRIFEKIINFWGGRILIKYKLNFPALTYFLSKYFLLGRLLLGKYLFGKFLKKID